MSGRGTRGSRSVASSSRGVWEQVAQTLADLNERLQRENPNPVVNPPQTPGPPQERDPPHTPEEEAEQVPVQAPPQTVAPVQARVTLDHFLRQSPEMFKGSTDPIEAEEWIDSLEKIYLVLGCTDNQKVLWAVYRLGGTANQWWKWIKRTTTPAQIEAMTWVEFKELFFAKYFPLVERAKMENEFLQISQVDGESIVQYEERFTRLSRFAQPYIQTEVRKIDWFLRGLKPGIGQQLLAHQLPTYQAAVESAQKVESGRKRYQDMHDVASSGKGKKKSDNKQGDQPQSKKAKTEPRSP